MRDLETISKELELVIEEQQQNQVIINNIDRGNKELANISKKLKEIEVQLNKEERDVEKLISISFSNFFQTMMNNKNEKLRQEEKEAMEVKVKFDQLHYDYDSTLADIKQFEENRKDEEELKSKYNMLFNEKIECIKITNPLSFEEIMLNSEKIKELKLAQKEVTEAINAGNNAIHQIAVIKKSLASAANWGTYDMLGGGMIATMAKRGHMNDAQREMQHFQRTIALFNKELQEVGDVVVMELQLQGFLDMADYFFDGFFVDWAVQDKINRARDQVNQLESKIRTILNQLQNELSEFLNEVKTLELKNVELVLEKR